MTPATTAEDWAARRHAPVRRALRMEAIQQRPLLWGGALLTAAVLVLAALRIGTFGAVPIVLAVIAPVWFSAQLPAHLQWLRASLGISRADHVRARVRLVLGVQLALITAAAVIIALRPPGEYASTMLATASSGTGSVHLTVSDAQDAVFWVSAILWSHVWVGRDALRSSSTLLTARVLLTYAVMYALMLVATLGGFSAVVELAGPGGETAPAEWIERASQPMPQAIVLAATSLIGVGGALAALAWRSRIWAREA